MVRTLRPSIGRMDVRSAQPAPKATDPDLLTREHRAWRWAVLQRAGHRCEAIDDGKRCEVRAPARLFADHIVERKDGGAPLDPRNGQCLCGSHHTLKTAAARSARMATR